MSSQSYFGDATANLSHEPEPEKLAIFFTVGAVKFAVMSISTLNLYPLYWFYKNFQCMRNQGREIWPLPRTIFFAVTAHSLFSAVHKQTPNPQFSPGSLAIALFLFILIVSPLPDPWGLIGFFYFLLLLPVRSAIEQINHRAAPNLDPNERFRGWNYVGMCMGSLAVAFTILSSINYLPSASVVEGSRLWKKDLDYLKAQDLLNGDEEILYFYTSEIWSIKDDGQFISDGYVVSYEHNPEDGELYGGNVAYGDIDDISVVWSKSSWNDTVITITEVDGYEFELWISPESRGDRKFVDEMMRRWKSTKNSMDREPN